MMRRAAAIFLAVLLLASGMTVAYAAPYDPNWIPPVPDFITPITNGFQIGGIGGYLGNAEYQEVSDWLRDLFVDGAVFFWLLDQGVYNRYNEEKGIEYDRQFTVYIVAPDKKSNGTYYDLGAFEHKGGPHHQEQMNVPSNMLYMCLNNPHSFAKLIYDEKTDKLVMQPTLSHLPAGSSLRFTYVLAAGDVYSFQGTGDPWQFTNGAFSETSEVYPGFTKICGKEFEVGTIYHQFVDGKAVNHWRDHDWWLGIKGDPIPPYDSSFDINQDTDGDGKPDLNVDTDGDGKPDINIDTDGDGKPDLNIDTNGDGKPDLNIDTDGDGKPDLNIDTDGDGKPDLNVDTNGDGKPDLNVDTNGDGKPDLNVDTNGDGKPDLNVDTNGDGKPDLNVDTNGDGKPDLNVDTDGDGKPDENVDIDGDGKPDVNVKPGSGSSGGSSSGDSSGGSSGSGDGDNGDSSGGNSGGGDRGGDSSGGNSSNKGSGPPDTWFKDEDETGTLNPWEFFDPFKYNYSPFPWNRDYDPLEGYQPGTMPDFPGLGNPNTPQKDPFDIPNDVEFKDFVIRFHGGK